MIGRTGVRAVILGSALAAAAALAAGCSKAGVKPQAEPTARESGAQLWEQNCMHCHNLQSPGKLSNAQWDVALLHMRVRANLTAREHKEILAFLKSSR